MAVPRPTAILKHVFARLDIVPFTRLLMKSVKHFCYQKNAGVRVQEVLAFQWVARRRRGPRRAAFPRGGPFVAAGGRSEQVQPKLLIMMILCAKNWARLGDRMSAGRRVEGTESIVVRRT